MLRTLSILVGLADGFFGGWGGGGVWGVFFTFWFPPRVPRPAASLLPGSRAGGAPSPVAGVGAVAGGRHPEDGGRLLATPADVGQGEDLDALRDGDGGRVQPAAARSATRSCSSTVSTVLRLLLVLRRRSVRVEAPVDALLLPLEREPARMAKLHVPPPPAPQKTPETTTCILK